MVIDRDLVGRSMRDEAPQLWGLAMGHTWAVEDFGALRFLIGLKKSRPCTRGRCDSAKKSMVFGDGNHTLLFSQPSAWKRSTLMSGFTRPPTSFRWALA